MAIITVVAGAEEDTMVVAGAEDPTVGAGEEGDPLVAGNVEDLDRIRDRLLGRV
jgi:hypothetical protein